LNKSEHNVQQLKLEDKSSPLIGFTGTAKLTEAND